MPANCEKFHPQNKLAIWYICGVNILVEWQNDNEVACLLASNEDNSARDIELEAHAAVLSQTDYKKEIPCKRLSWTQIVRQYSTDRCHRLFNLPSLAVMSRAR